MSPAAWTSGLRPQKRKTARRRGRAAGVGGNERAPGFAGGSYLIVPETVRLRCTPVNTSLLPGRSMAEVDHTSEFEKVNLHIVTVIKNTAELLVVTGLFSFIGKAYNSSEATIFSGLLLLALGSYLSLSILHYALQIPKVGHKHFGWVLAASVVAAITLTVVLQLFLLAPTLRAIERQLTATPPAIQLPAAHARAGIQAQPSAGTAAPKPDAAPSAATAAAPAPSVPPSDGPSRNSSHEAHKPD